MSRISGESQSTGAFAALLLRRRRDLGIDQSELSRRIGVSQQTVSRWEAGVNVPARRHLPDLARHLRMSEAELLTAVGFSTDASGPALRLAEVLQLLPQIDEASLLALLDAAWAEYRSRQTGGAPRRSAEDHLK